HRLARAGTAGRLHVGGSEAAHRPDAPDPGAFFRAAPPGGGRHSLRRAAASARRPRDVAAARAQLSACRADRIPASAPCGENRGSRAIAAGLTPLPPPAGGGAREWRGRNGRCSRWLLIILS